MNPHPQGSAASRRRAVCAAAVGVVSALMGAVSPAAAQPCPAATVQVCPAAANPCVVGTATVASGSVINIGTRDLVIDTSRTLTVSGAGNVTICAGSLTIRPGGRILADGAAGNGGDVSITTTGAVELQATTTLIGRIDVSSTEGGSMEIMPGGDMTVGGLLDARGTLDGGAITLDVGGNLTIGGQGINIRGGSTGGGGLLDATAAGTITVNALIEAAAGDFDGGEIDLTSNGADIVTGLGGTLDVSAGGMGFGGTIDLEAAGSVTVNGFIDGSAGASIDSGDGADFTVTADTGDFVLNANVDVTGADGGLSDVQATLGNVAQNGAILASAKFIDGCGGEADFAAGSALTIGNVDTTGGTCGGGFVSADAVTMAVNGSVLLDGVAGPGGAGNGGSSQLHACTLNVNAGAKLSALGPTGINLLQANGPMTIAAPVVAGDVNRLEYATVPPTVIVQPVPAPQIVQVVDLSQCGIPMTTTTTSTTSTTSTSGTIGATTSTTTTVSQPSSTTTTSQPVVTTMTTSTSTTMLPITTTTTTTLGTSTTTTASTSTTVTTATASSSTTGTTPTTSSTTTTQPLEICNDGVDNDGDGLVDCSDPDCATDPVCQGECPVGPTFVSLDCRLAALIAALGGGQRQATAQSLAIPVTKARARADQAEALCSKGDARHARAALRHAIRRMNGFERRLRSLTDRGLVPPASSAELLAAAEAIEGDLRTLLGALVCP